MWNARLNRRRLLVSGAAIGAALPFGLGAARTENIPAGTIRAIIPFAAGSGSDVAARAVLDKVSNQIGKPIIVDNRTGAGGTIGAAVVAQATPDGETLLIDSSAHTTRPFFYHSLDFDPVKDFVTVGSVATIPLVLIVSSAKGIKTARELVDYAKANPDKVTYASGGAGSATHLAAERFRLQAGFKGVHVPFRGGQEGMREVLAGRVDFYFLPILPALAFIENGQLNALAVSTTERAKKLPDVPTLAEAGYPNADYNFWIGAFAPARTPVTIVDALHQQIDDAVKSPEIAGKLAGFGAEPMLMSRADFDVFLKRELGMNGPLIAATGMVPEQ
jgi:tripartite-type tricarboxylate transporter receptor subunit TctC